MSDQQEYITYVTLYRYHKRIPAFMENSPTFRPKCYTFLFAQKTKEKQLP